MLAAVSVVCAIQFSLAGTLTDVFATVLVQDIIFLAVGLLLGGLVDRQHRRRKERDQIKVQLIEERLKHRELNIQMETASKIHALFRPRLPDPRAGSHVFAASRPAKFVGGDLYDIIPMPDRSWLVYVAMCRASEHLAVVGFTAVAGCQSQIHEARASERGQNDDDPLPSQRVFLSMLCHGYLQSDQARAPAGPCQVHPRYSKQLSMKSGSSRKPTLVPAATAAPKR